MKLKPFIRTGFFLSVMLYSSYAQQTPYADGGTSPKETDSLLEEEGSLISERMPIQGCSSPLMMLGDFFGKKSSMEESGYRGDQSDSELTDLNISAAALREPCPSSETILHRGYLELSPQEFQAVVGEPESFWSWHQRILTGLKKYSELSSSEEKQIFLPELTNLAKASLKKNADGLRRELKKPIADEVLSDRYHHRMKVCNLLLRGLEIESAKLNGVELSSSDRDSSLSNRKGILFSGETIQEYKENYASGGMSKIDCFRDLRFPDKRFIFKEEGSQKVLPELLASQLGFPRNYASQFGVTAKIANLAGRALATYRISELLQCSLVPRTGFAVFGEKGRARFGYYQEFIDGIQLYKEEEKEINEEEGQAHFGGLENWKEVLVEMVLGRNYQDGISLSFPDYVTQVGLEKPLLEKGIPISEERAEELIENNVFSLKRKVIHSVNEEINFRDPCLQQAMANIHLLYLLSGELDPNPLNLIYIKQPNHHWGVRVIDSEISFPSYFTKLDDQFIEELRTDKSAHYIRSLPDLIDETMGEKILSLKPDQIEDALEGAGLTIKEIEAAKARLQELQTHIEAIKNSKGLVKLAPLESNAALIWGDATYQLAIQEESKSYLAMNMVARFSKTNELRQLKKLPRLFSDQVVSSERAAALDSTKLDTVSLNSNKFAHEIGFPFRRHSTETVDTDLTSNTEHTHQALKRLLDMTGDLLNSSQLYFTPYLESNKNSIASLVSEAVGVVKSWLFSPISREMEYLIFQTNLHLLEIYQKEKGAQTSLVIAQKTLGCPIDLEQKKSSWQEAIIQLREVVESFENAIASYHQEEAAELLPERKSQFNEIKRKYDLCLVKLHWASLHHAEALSALHWKEQEEFSSLTSKQKERLVESVLHAQQAWRELMGFLGSELESPSLEWRQQWAKNFELAKSAEQVTPFFSQWLAAAEYRHKAIESDFITNCIEYNKEECKSWENLWSEAKNMKDALLIHSEELKDLYCRIENYLLDEIELQRLYASAEQASLNTRKLKEEVMTLASLPLIETAIYKVEGGVHHELSIVAVKSDQIKRLCNIWNDLKTQRAREVESLGNVASSYRNFVNNAYQNQQGGLRRKKTFMSVMPTYLEPHIPFNETDLPCTEKHGFYPQVVSKLMRAQKEAAAWKPSFPSIKLEKWEQVTGFGEDKEYYILKTHDEVIPMQRLVEAIKEKKHEEYDLLWPCIASLEMVEIPFVARSRDSSINGSERVRVDGASINGSYSETATNLSSSVL